MSSRSALLCWLMNILKAIFYETVSSPTVEKKTSFLLPVHTEDDHSA